MTPGLRRSHAIAVAGLVIAATVACNSPSLPSLTQGPKLAKDQTLRVLLADQPLSLDPGQTQYPYETAVLRAISEPLLKPTADLANVVAAAAQSYEVANNGSVYVFHLRTTAQYGDGVPVKAQDFVYAWRRLIDPRLASPSETLFANTVLNGQQVSVMDPQRDASRIDTALATLGLKALDDYTFQVTLSRSDPAFIWLAAMPAGAPIRQDLVTKNGDKWAASPDSLVTNGPFKVTEMAANNHLTAVPNTHYWGPKPTLTAINFVVVNDGAVALTRYKNGELDEISVQPAQAAGVAGTATLNKDLIKTPDLTVFWIVFRVNASPLNNRKLRLALAEAIDREALVAQVFQGQGIPAESFIPKGMHGYSSNLGSAQKFDVTQAKASLAASGVTAAQLAGLTFAYDQSSDFGKATANFVHDQLKANLEINITLQGVDTNTLSARLESGDFQIAGPRGWSADYPDPADWYDNFLTSSNNVEFYQNPQYDNFVRAARTDMQPARRDQEYQQAQQMLVSDAPVAFLAQTVSWNLLRPYVRGVTTSPVDEWPGALFPTKISIAPH